MPYLTFSTSPDGLAVDVLVGLRRSQIQALRTAGHVVPTPIQLRALVDTGADMTSLADAAAATLGLVPIGTMLVNTASGMTIVNRYAIGLTIPAPGGGSARDLVRPNLSVLGMANAPLGFDLLIGLDVLADCLFLVDGRAGQFTIAF